jgi:hypothetical protein
MMSGFFLSAGCASEGFREPSDTVKNLVVGRLCFEITDWEFFRSSRGEALFTYQALYQK